MPLTVEQIDDLTASTLPHLTKRNLAQMAQTFQNYEILSKWFTKEKVQKKGGHSIEMRLMDQLPDSAAHITIDQSDNPTIAKLLDKMTIPWRHFQSYYAWYIEEILMNSGESEIVDLLSARRDASKIRTAEVLEIKAWACPVAANKVDPYGVPYWIVKNAVEGFNGGLPADHTTIAGLDLDEHPNFKNYTGTYTAISASDLIRKLRKAMDQTAFKSPIGKDEFYGMKGKSWRLYTNLETKLAIEDLARAQNENLGADLAAMDGQTTVRGNALMRANPLDNDTQNPIYGINHNTFKVVTLQGAFFRDSGQMVVPTNHRARVVYNDTTYNYMCMNRRHNFVLYQA